MATTSKLSFRARNLDANKAMCVFFASELPDLSECAPIARAVAQMPTGMEKEEEMVSPQHGCLRALSIHRFTPTCFLTLSLFRISSNRIFAEPIADAERYTLTPTMTLVQYWRASQGFLDGSFMKVTRRRFAMLECRAFSANYENAFPVKVFPLISHRTAA
ncbi:hypothetical protein Y032_0005g2658 [Ancylostoma ceylanicum]|uniref:Uncharacterized protein n=1 Tax=Ancylostoma ceylanicum TaxID=53326 RepID=A0A016VUM2_9BILA|nr:hypothetical protein Y032_0005g2658 [Ancylostoma ceylanicum]